MDRKFQRVLISALLVIVLVTGGVGAAFARDNAECPTAEEKKLVKLVNAYRANNRLPAIAISPSLTYVAHRHIEDLIKQGKLGHGWLDCPYSSSDRSTWPCMWEAPQRLGTPYKGRGYENAHGGIKGYRASPFKMSSHRYQFSG